MASAQVAILQIKVVEGEGAVHLPGVRSPRNLVAEVTDETGRPVSGAAVSFHVPESGPGGAFPNGLRTEIVITDSHGRATLHGFLANRTAGRFQLRILASREQARAGIVSFQYVADLKPSAATPTARNNKKWLVIGAGIAGGAVVALLASHGGSSSPAAALPAAPPVPALTIGTPTITVGKP
ncbi:MAG: hypothetical protein JWP63_2124 [Candidatus Solibacter sp.]|nr:hypothetical protein [Candidatus Solibacter sp.]